MIQNRVFAVYFSMIRRSAICAVAVIASASSRMINLKEPRDEPDFVAGATENICFVPEMWPSQQKRRKENDEERKVKLNRLAKVFICSLTTSMPLSSLALSSITICRIFWLPYIRRAKARIVEVLPVPGGPYRSRCGKRCGPLLARYLKSHGQYPYFLLHLIR